MKNITYLLFPLILAGCAAQSTTTHGQVILPSRLSQVQQGVSTKQDVMQLLGSPSTMATMEDNRWVYVSSVVLNKPLNQGVLQKRQVIVVEFDPSGTVAGITDKNEVDGRVIEPDSAQTKTYGQSLGIVDSMMQNLGNLGK